MTTSTIPPYILWAGCPSCHPTNNVKALKADSYMHMKSLACWWHAVLIICVMLSDVNLHCLTWHAACGQMLCCCLIYHHLCGNVTTVCLGWLCINHLLTVIIGCDGCVWVSFSALTEFWFSDRNCICPIINLQWLFLEVICWSQCRRESSGIWLTEFHRYSSVIVCSNPVT